MLQTYTDNQSIKSDGRFHYIDFIMYLRCMLTLLFIGYVNSLECYDDASAGYKDCKHECAVVSGNFRVEGVKRMCSEDAPFHPVKGKDCALAAHLKDGTKYEMVCGCDSPRCNEDTTEMIIDNKNHDDYIDPGITTARSCMYKSTNQTGHVLTLSFTCPIGFKYCVDDITMVYSVKQVDNDDSTSLLYTSDGIDESQTVTEAYCMGLKFRYKAKEVEAFGCMTVASDSADKIRRKCVCHLDQCNKDEDMNGKIFHAVDMGDEDVVACSSSGDAAIEICGPSNFGRPVCMHNQLNKGVPQPIRSSGCLTEEMAEKFSLDEGHLALERSCYGNEVLEHVICMCHASMCNQDLSEMVQDDAYYTMCENYDVAYALTVSLNPSQQVVHPSPTSTFTLKCGKDRAIDGERKEVEQICKLSGRTVKWSPFIKECKRECPQNVAVPHASITYPTYPVVDTSATMVCDEGMKTGIKYQHASAQIKCLRDGAYGAKWASPSVCKRMCPHLSLIRDANVEYSKMQTYMDSGDKASLTCKPGYIVKGSKHRSIQLICTEGVWSSLPACERDGLYSVLHRENQTRNEFNNEGENQILLAESRKVDLKKLRKMSVDSYLKNRDESTYTISGTSLSKAQLAVSMALGIICFALLMIFICYEMQRSMMKNFYKIQHNTKID